MEIRELTKILDLLYLEGYDNGMNYVSNLEFGNGKSPISIQKEKEQEISSAFNKIIDLFQMYLNELLERIAPVKTEYSRGVEISYAALIRQFQIWKDMERIK
jgi:hypothetical protein